jgi:hypothetical protein
MVAEPPLRAPEAERDVGENLVARLRKRIFEPQRAGAIQPDKTDKPETLSRREIGFRASLAELLLINRLRARSTAEPSADVLENGARVVVTTCKNWFSSPKPDSGAPRTRL